MRILVVTLLFASPAFAQQPQSHCTPAPKTQLTIWWNINLQIDMSNPVKALTGIVSLANGTNGISTSEAEGVLVEIYPARKREYSWRPGDTKHPRKRLYACFTGANGAFEFDVPSGLYHLVVSKKYFKTTIALVSVDRKRGEAKALIVPLEVGM